MNLHHVGLSPYQMREKLHYWKMDDTISYTLWMIQSKRRHPQGDLRFNGHDPIFNTQKKVTMT
jgi:hypothetical protein